MTATLETPLMAGNVPVFPRCETCKWWDTSFASSGWGQCGVITTQLWNNDEQAIAYINDAAELATRRDFGCILHEKRDEA